MVDLEPHLLGSLGLSRCCLAWKLFPGADGHRTPDDAAFGLLAPAKQPSVHFLVQNNTSVLIPCESDDTARFGRARTAWEKELRDPDDVFIEAEERRREFARQAKKLAAKRSTTNALAIYSQ